MNTLIKTFPVETSSDQQLSLQVHKVNHYRSDVLTYTEVVACAVIKQELGLEDDGILSVMLNQSQIDKLIGQLFIAKAELEIRNKELRNNNK